MHFDIYIWYMFFFKTIPFLKPTARTWNWIVWELTWNLLLGLEILAATKCYFQGVLVYEKFFAESPNISGT